MTPRPSWLRSPRMYGSPDAQTTDTDRRLAVAWQTPIEKRTPEQRALIAGQAPIQQRAAPVQYESTEQARLWRMVKKSAWWRPGYWRWEAAVWTDSEARRRAREGVRPGWPDCGLFIPETELKHPVMAALEMKAPQNAPKRAVADRWWLAPMGKAQSRYGLSREQGAVLATLDALGWDTYVAYGAEDAYAWLDARAGPRPAELPGEWEYWTDGPFGPASL